MECIVRLSKSDKINKDDTFKMTAKLLSYDVEIATKETSLTVGDETTYVDLYAVSVE